MSRLTRDGTAEPVSRDQILRHECGQGNIPFSCSADHVQDWQPYPVDPYSCYVCDHTYIHTPSGQCRVYRVTHLRTDGVHCRESVGTRPVVLNGVPETGAPFAVHHGPIDARLSFPTPTIIGMKWAHVEINGSAYLQSMDFQREPQSKRHLYFLDCFFFTSWPTRPNPTHIAHANPDPHPS